MTQQPRLQAVTDDEPVGAAIEELRTRLLARAFLFDDPYAYCAGVEDTVAALAGRRRDRASGASAASERDDRPSEA